MPNPVVDRNSWYQRNACSQERFTCVNRSCQRPPIPRLLNRKSPTSMRAKSTASVEVIEIMLNLALSTSDTPQTRRGAIQIVWVVATPDVWLIAAHQRKPKKNVQYMQTARFVSHAPPAMVITILLRSQIATLRGKPSARKAHNSIVHSRAKNDQR